MYNTTAWFYKWQILFLTNLLETFESWTEDVDKGYSVDVIFLDFQKAFDKVPKTRLLQKLSAYEIEGKVLCWIADFLSDRKIRIMVRGEYSEWVDVISGVPQGSVLGPLLFLIYVNDIPETVNCSIKMFADDTKLFITVKTIDDCNILQNDLKTLSQRTNDWLLSFDVDKCKGMHIGKNNPKLDYTMRTENENRILIETSEEKDLGVWITNDLKHEKQVIAASQRAMAVLRSVRRAFVQFDIETFSIIYTSYIRPHLEYCIQAWSPYTRIHVCASFRGPQQCLSTCKFRLHKCLTHCQPPAVDHAGVRALCCRNSFCMSAL